VLLSFARLPRGPSLIEFLAYKTMSPANFTTTVGCIAGECASAQSQPLCLVTTPSASVTTPVPCTSSRCSRLPLRGGTSSLSSSHTRPCLLPTLPLLGVLLVSAPLLSHSALCLVTPVSLVTFPLCTAIIHLVVILEASVLCGDSVMFSIFRTLFPCGCFWSTPKHGSSSTEPGSPGLSKAQHL